MAALSTCPAPRLGYGSSSIFGSGTLRLSSKPLLRVAAPVPSTITAGIIGSGKRWEHLPTNDNGKVIKPKMHVKKGDVVQVIAGKDKGKVGKVSDVLTKVGQVLVEGVNIKTKHVKPKAGGESGQIVQRESPVHHSNVMVYSEEKKVRSKVGYKMEGEKKVRYLKKTGEVLP